tara:strand:- start:158 stop:1069 length:912 start_codon:yes stop_codon:yes gene_type:complete
MYKDKISVIMSVNKESMYLEESITSILNQSHSKFEFLIVDDFANKKVKKILNIYKKKDKRIKVIKNKKNLGLTKSLIYAIKFSNCNFISRIDADDYSDKDRLKMQLKWLKKSSKRVMCGTNYSLVRGNKIIKKNIIFDKKNIIKNMMYKNCFIHSSAMFKKNYYKRVGGYNPFFYYAQDYDLWSRLSSVGEVGNLEKRLTFFRDHPSSISRSKTEKQMKYSIIVSCNNYFYSKYKRFFKINLNLEKNHFFLKNNALIKDFYRCISFLNRKKLKVKGIENLPQLSLKSLFFCLKQPKMFIYNLL